MYCQECGNKHRDTAKFCPYCGSRIEPPEELAEEILSEPAAKPTDETPRAVTPEPTPIVKKADTADADNPVPARPRFYSEFIIEKEKKPEAAMPVPKPETAVAKPEIKLSPPEKLATERPADTPPERDKYIIWRTLIGESSEYYIAEFERIAQGEPSFNWTAFFFGGILMLYRRMYAYFVKCYLPLLLFLFTGCFMMMLGLATLEPVYIMTGSALCGLIVLYWFVVAMSAGSHFNRHYFKHLQWIIQTYDLADTSPEELHTIKKYGETAVVPIVVVFLLTVLGLLGVQYLGIRMGADILRNLMSGT